MVYELSYLYCPSSYNGESAITLRSRVEEHSKPGTSTVFEHSLLANHTVDTNGVKVLDREDIWFKRGVYRSSAEEVILTRRRGATNYHLHITAFFHLTDVQLPVR